MKSKILFYIAVGLAFLTVSCDSYLDKEPDDMQTIEGVFAKRSTTELSGQCLCLLAGTV